MIDDADQPIMLTFVVPDDGGVVSGGHVYNRHVLSEWRAAGRPVEVLTLPGSWPFPRERDRVRLAAALRGRGLVLLDGLVGCACPCEVTDARAAGSSIHLLVHLPLPAECGLTDAQTAALADTERRAIHAASGVVATSHTAAQDLRDRYGRPDIGVATPGVDPAPPAAGSTPPRLLTLAALTPRKNHTTLIAALSVLGDRAWTASFAGPASPADERRVRDALVDAGLADRIELPGPLAGAALAAQWHAADLLVLPSLAETFGLVVTEALARGLPAVVAAGTGAVEALTGVPPGNPSPDPVASPLAGPLAGAAVDAADPASLADVLGRWLDDSAVRDTWRRAAARRRVSLPAWSQTADNLHNLLV